MSKKHVYNNEMTVHLMDVTKGFIRIYKTGRWAHINVKLLHSSFMYEYFLGLINKQVIETIVVLTEYITITPYL